MTFCLLWSHYLPLRASDQSKMMALFSRCQPIHLCLRSLLTSLNPPKFPIGWRFHWGERWRGLWSPWYAKVTRCISWSVSSPKVATRGTNYTFKCAISSLFLRTFFNSLIFSFMQTLGWAEALPNCHACFDWCLCPRNYRVDPWLHGWCWRRD